MKNEINAAYSKGYSAGRKRCRREEIAAQVRNERYTALASAIITAGMTGGWGVDNKDGKHIPHSLEKLQKMAIKSAREMTNIMDVYS